MAYGGPNNFTGSPLPGYCGTRAWLHESCVDSLADIGKEFQERGFGLRLYDAYRPIRAVRAMMHWAEHAGQTHLVDEGYLAPVSRHSKGCAVDVTLVDLKTGQALDMGTDWDAFDARSHSSWGSGRIRIHRDWLSAPFTKRGWRAARTEWWHFDKDIDGVLALDVPYG